jgi:hypothetical protein
MRRAGGGTFQFPNSMEPFTEPVPYALYEVRGSHLDMRSRGHTPHSQLRPAVQTPPPGGPRH